MPRSDSHPTAQEPVAKQVTHRCYGAKHGSSASKVRLSGERFLKVHSTTPPAERDRSSRGRSVQVIFNDAVTLKFQGGGQSMSGYVAELNPKLDSTGEASKMKAVTKRK